MILGSNHHAFVHSYPSRARGSPVQTTRSHDTMHALLCCCHGRAASRQARIGRALYINRVATPSRHRRRQTARASKRGRHGGATEPGGPRAARRGGPDKAAPERHGVPVPVPEPAGEQQRALRHAEQGAERGAGGAVRRLLRLLLLHRQLRGRGRARVLRRGDAAGPAHLHARPGRRRPGPVGVPPPRRRLRARRALAARLRHPRAPRRRHRRLPLPGAGARRAHHDGRAPARRRRRRGLRLHGVPQQPARRRVPAHARHRGLPAQILASRFVVVAEYCTARVSLIVCLSDSFICLVVWGCRLCTSSLLVHSGFH
uniref:Uncharacterized protein n=1 Tax=Zea mays TaxID=4577 RepID=A0A804R9S5_MAIZE